MYSDSKVMWGRVLGAATIVALVFGMLPIQYYTANAQEEEEESDEEVVEEVDVESGIITIIKEVTASSSTSTPFTFQSSWSADFVLLAGQSTSTTLAIGSYSIAELVPVGWNDPEVSCVSSFEDDEAFAELSLAADEVITCTFLNDQELNTPVEDTYTIEGYVWHDDNENKIWEGFGEEGATTTEEDLQGWTVNITDGETTKSVVTDENGHYSFEVTEGTWTITEEVKVGWKRTTPVSGNYVVVVPTPATSTPTTTALSVFDRIVAFLVPTAEAAVVETKGPFNFGNNELPPDTNGGGNNGSGGGGGGGSSSPRCDVFTAEVDDDEIVLSWETRRGSDIKIEADGRRIYSESDNDIVSEGTTTIDDDGQEEFILTVSRNSRTDTCEVDRRDAESNSSGNNGGGTSGSDTPTPQVLGEQVSVVPQGAPNAGAGGSSTAVDLSTVTSLLVRRESTA